MAAPPGVGRPSRMSAIELIVGQGALPQGIGEIGPGAAFARGPVADGAMARVDPLAGPDSGLGGSQLGEQKQLTDSFHRGQKGVYHLPRGSHGATLGNAHLAQHRNRSSVDLVWETQLGGRDLVMELRALNLCSQPGLGVKPLQVPPDVSHQ